MKVRNNSDFLKKLESVNSHYSEGSFICKTRYVKSACKIIVKDSFGYHRMTPYSLLKGSKPSIKTAIFRYNYLKEVLCSKNTKFNKREYILKEVVEGYKAIVATKYGDCVCYISNLYKSEKSLSISSAIDKTTYAKNEFNEIHNGKYDYSDFVYKTAKKSFYLHCKKHGAFKTSYYEHKYGRYCPKCSFKKYIGSGIGLRFLHFKDLCELKHPNSFIYDENSFSTQNDNLKIVCKKCNHSFIRKGINHLNSKGCPLCYNNYKTGSFKWWKQCCKGSLGIFYILECRNDAERFFKIGITCQTVEKRYRKKKLMPYNYKVIFKYTSEDKEEIYKAEQIMKVCMKKYRYKPIIKFGGSKTECLDIEALRENNINIKDFAAEYLKNLK